MRFVVYLALYFLVLLALVGAALGQQGSGSVQADAGIEVLTRGPVHEAYAEPVDASPQATPLIKKQPPEPIPEMPPDQKPEGDKVEWISGYWAWDADRSDYIWVSGFWRTAPPGRAWVPGHWQPMGSDGWQWVPGFWNVAEKTELTYVPAPPAPLEERIVPSPGEEYFYSPGVWVYRDGRHFWRPGVWMAYQTDYLWVPAHYVWTPGGYVFVDGYWDHSLARRGMLFAPVYVSPEIIVRTEFCYVPRHVVCHEFMVGCLFVRPACRHYYYGDYFEARYTDEGYVAFVDYRIAGRYHDPLFGYYVHYPPSRNWERETRAVYVGRYHGDIARPPHTFAEQEKVHITLAVSINEPERHGIKTEKISREQVAQARQVAVERHEVAVQRQKVETEIHSHGPAKTGEAPRVLKLDAPARPAHVEAKPGNTPGTSTQPQTNVGSNPGGLTAPGHPGTTPPVVPNPAHAGSGSMPPAHPAAPGTGTTTPGRPITVPSSPTQPGTTVPQLPGRVTTPPPAPVTPLKPPAGSGSRPGTLPGLPKKDPPPKDKDKKDRQQD